jgi:hypothetical protein
MRVGSNGSCQEELEHLPRREAPHEFIEGELDHQSPLIRALTPHAMLLPYHALDVFTVLYLQARPDADGLSFGAGGSLTDHLARLREEVSSGEAEDETAPTERAEDQPSEEAKGEGGADAE